jgi:hypothetical protein
MAATSSAKSNVFKFNANFGQYILKYIGVSDAIVEKAFLKPTDTVLEIVQLDRLHLGTRQEGYSCGI